MAANGMNPLIKLEQCGQSPWLDALSRPLVTTGGLAHLIASDGLKGVTSNPSIFALAMQADGAYDDASAQFQAQGDHSVSEIYEHLAIADVQAAADLLLPVYHQSEGCDGFVSLECSPYLAHDRTGTIAEATRLWAAVDRANLMVKVPATAAGIAALRILIGSGLNINVTLLFSVELYAEVADSYMAGLEDLAAAGGTLSRVASVASMFVSRIDVAVDARLRHLPPSDHGARLLNRIGIANSKISYRRYQALVATPRWQALAAKGANPQRLLWASTGTKSKDVKDTFYVEALIGRDTVNTMPPATMAAFRLQGEVICDAIGQDLVAADADLARLAQLGVSLEEVTQQLLTDGLAKFSDSFDSLLGTLAKRRLGLLSGDRFRIGPGGKAMQSAMEAESESWRQTGAIRRLWAGDPALWSNQHESAWLDWLRVAEHELGDIERLQAFAASVKQDGFTDLLLLGMGGSSLGPAVFGLSFPQQFCWPRFHLLDSTDPAEIGAIKAALDLRRTLVVVSSKSGDTLETSLLLDYFWHEVALLSGADKAGRQFVAVTDAGSPLEARAKQLGFFQVFHGLPGIGGRYSVLSKFGTVVAAGLGLDVKRLLQATLIMQRSCGPDVPPAENPGVALGIALGIAATRFGRDKVTILTDDNIGNLGAWLEQLLAESTGKQGRGLIPLTDEPLASPKYYGDDRFFLSFERDGYHDPARQQALDALEAAGHPVVHIGVADIWQIGQEFFRLEIATAVAGAIIGINPFDQPDVEASKVRTLALLGDGEARPKPAEQQPIFHENGLALFADPGNARQLGRHNSLAGYLRSHFARVQARDYAALLAYLPRNDANSDQLNRMRRHIRDHTHAATCLGFGPRFQHSTGQVYKGGPNSGVFLQITCDDPVDIAVPGQAASFGRIKAAEAEGDLAVLVERDRRVLRVHLKHSDPGLVQLTDAVVSALA